MGPPILRAAYHYRGRGRQRDHPPPLVGRGLQRSRRPGRKPDLLWQLWLLWRLAIIQPPPAPHGAGFFMPSKLSSASAYIPTPSTRSPPLVRRPTARRRHFCARVWQGRGEAKTQNRRKGHLQAPHGVLYPHGYPSIPSPKNAAQRLPEARAWHKATPARSAME